MFKLNTFKLFGFPIFWHWVYLMKVIPIFWHWVYLMKVITIFWHWVYLMKVIPIFWHWVYLMKVIPIFWHWVYLMKDIPIFWHWVYLMKVIPIFWHWVYLMKVILSVPDEGYSECTWWRLFQSFDIECTWWRLFQSFDIECTWWRLFQSFDIECTWWRLLQSFDIECTLWRLFQKCVMCTKFDICFYFSYVKHYPPLWFLLQFSIRCFRCFYILSCRLWQNATKKFWYFILKQIIHICIIHILSNNLAVLEKFTNLFNLIKFLKQYMTTVI